MEEAEWLRELNAAPENIKRQVGRRQMGSEWQERLAGAGDGARMLEGTCSAFRACCTFSGPVACSKAAVKSNSGHCFKALTRSCLKGLYKFVRDWKQKCE